MPDQSDNNTSVPADASAVKPAQPPAPQPNKCRACGHLNRPGSLICDNCGTSLLAGESAIGGTKRFNKTGEAEGEGTIKVSTEEFAAVTAAGSTKFTRDMILRLEIEGSSTPLLVPFRHELALGRRDPSTGNMPEIDLTAFAAYRLGVSRRHAILKADGEKLEVYDLGSSNGTAINGNKLAPHQPHILRDGDMIVLGKMVMRAIFHQKR